MKLHITWGAVLLVLLIWVAIRFQPKTRTAPTTADNNAPAVLVAAGAESGNALTWAYQMAAYVDQVRQQVAADQETTREQLKGLQVAWFLNDYVMASKTNRDLSLTTTAIVKAFTNVTRETRMVRGTLTTYAERPGTLSDHYRSTSQGAQTGPEFAAVTQAMRESGVGVDTESDLIMDCMRFAAYHTEIKEMYGAAPRKPESATPYAPALESLTAAADAVFAYRFAERFGLSAATASNLMDRLKKLDVHRLTDADMQVPASIR